jgi:hypothetical protein
MDFLRRHYFWKRPRDNASGDGRCSVTCDAAIIAEPVGASGKESHDAGDAEGNLPVNDHFFRCLLTQAIKYGTLKYVNMTGVDRAVNVEHLTSPSVDLRLRHFNLSSHDGLPVFLRALAVATPNGLGLDLECNELGDDGIAAVADALFADDGVVPFGGTLAFIHLASNRMSSTGLIRFLDRAEQHGTDILRLGVSNNPIGPLGVDRLVQFVVGRRLHSVHLCHVGMRTEGASALIDALRTAHESAAEKPRVFAGQNDDVRWELVDIRGVFLKL